MKPTNKAFHAMLSSGLRIEVLRDNGDGTATVWREFGGPGEYATWVESWENIKEATE